MISDRFPVPVESHTRERERVVAEPTPQVGLAWGSPSQFSIVNPPPPSSGGAEPEDDSPDENGGFTVRLWPQEIHTERTYRLSPVWRKFNVARITADNSDATIDVAVTTQLLFPIRSKLMKYTSGGSYVEDPEGLLYEERMIHSYVRLHVPPPDVEWEIVRWDLEEGEWPAYRDEMFSPGTYTPTTSWQTHFNSGDFSR